MKKIKIQNNNIKQKKLLQFFKKLKNILKYFSKD